MRQRTRTILVVLAIIAMVAPLAASMGPPGPKPRGDVATRSDGTGQAVVDPAEGSAEGAVGRLLTAARNPDAGAGFQAATPLLSSLVTQDAARLDEVRTQRFEALRREVGGVLAVEGPNAFRLVRTDQDATGRVRFMVAKADGTALPFILSRDPKAGGAWRVEQF